MTEQERINGAKAAFERFTRQLQRDYGVNVEAVLDAEKITDNYITARARLAFRVMPIWAVPIREENNEYPADAWLEEIVQAQAQESEDS